MPFTTKADEVVSYLSLAIDGVALGSAAYTSAKDDLIVKGESAYAANAAAKLASMSTADVAAQVLTNLGVTASTIGQAGYDALLPAFITQLDLYGVASRGQVILNVTRLLAPLTADATYGNAAKAWVATGDKAQVYSSNPANTASATIATLNPASLSLALTTSAETLTGGAGNDTFTSSFLTANAGDSLDGGAGNDTLNIETSTDISKLFATNAIETINVTSYGARTFNADAVKGANVINTVNSTAALTIAGLQSNVGLGFAGSNTNSISATYTADALAGTADALKVTLNSAPSSSVTVNSGFESVEVVSTGTGNTVTGLTVPGATKLTVSGSGNVTFSGGSAAGFSDITVTNSGTTALGAITSLTKFTGSGAGAESFSATGAAAGANISTGSGNDTVTLTDGTTSSTGSNVVTLGDGNDGLTFVRGTGGGSTVVFAGNGNDTVTISSTSSAISSADVFDLGAGNDTVSISNAQANTLNLKGVENITLSSSVAGSKQTFNADQALAISAAASATTSTSVDVANLPAGSTLTISSGNLNNLTMAYTATEAATTVAVRGNAVGGTVTASKVTSLTMNITGSSTAGTPTSTGAITLADTTTLIVDSASTVNDFTLGAIGSTSAVGTLTVTGKNAITVQAPSATALSTVTVGGVKAVSMGAVASAASLSTVDVSSTESSASAAAIGGTTRAASLSSVKVTGATNATLNATSATVLGNVTVTASNGTAVVDTITANQTTSTIGTVAITSTTGAIDFNGVTGRDAGGYAVTLSGKTFINSTGATGGAATSLTNNRGDITVTLSGEAVATVDATSNSGAATEGAGVVVINASGLTGGLTTNVGNESTTGVSSVTFGAKDSTTVNSVTFTGAAKSLSVTGSAGKDTVVDASTGVAPAGIGGADQNVVNSSDTFAGGTGTDTISYAGHLHTTVTGLATNAGASNGMAINLSSSAVTFNSGTDFATSVAAGTAAQYDSAGTGLSANARTIIAGGEVDTLSGFEAVVGTSKNDYIVSSAADMTITGGAGADTIVLGTGAYELVIATGHTAQVNGSTLYDANTGSAVGFDIVTGFSSNDKLTLTDAAGTKLNLAGATYVTSTVNLAEGNHYIIRGTYNSADGSFKVSATGASTLVIWDTNGADTGGFQGVVLVGYYSSNLSVTGGTVSQG